MYQLKLKGIYGKVLLKIEIESLGRANTYREY